MKWRGAACRIDFDLPRRRAVVLAHAAGPGLVERRLQLVGTGLHADDEAAFNMPDPYGDLPTLEAPLAEPRLDWRATHAIGQRLMAE